MGSGYNDLKRLASAVAQQRANWLIREFEKATLEREKPDKLVLCLPNLFNARVVSSTKSGRQEARLSPFKVRAGSPEEAVCLLYEKIMTTADPDVRGLYEYVPQEGQCFELNTPYKVIVNNDPEHDHNSLRVINLLPVRAVGPYMLSKGSLDGDHSHLLIK